VATAANPVMASAANPVMSYPGVTIAAMAARREPEPAAQPEDLGTLFLERANAGDVEGLVALYEPDAVLAFPAGRLATGHEEIRSVYAELLSGRPRFSSAGQQPAIRNGDLALTSTRLPGGGATVEVARQQPDGSWRWVIDQPAVLP
jgi:ketosteroid isomerase-like protein